MLSERASGSHEGRENIAFVILTNFLYDVRHGTRALVRQPVFSAVVFATLALGIGAATAICCVVDGVLLRPLPYPNPKQIVTLWEQAPDGHRMALADPNFDDFKAQSDTFAGLAEYSNDVSTSASGGTEPVKITIVAVSSAFFQSMGVVPFRGRSFTAEEQHVNGSPAMIVSYKYWQRYLGGSNDLSKFHVTIEGESFPGMFPVIGVMPRGFDFPRGVDAWIPRELEPESSSRGAHNFQCVGRLREGVTIAQARANLSIIAHRLRTQYGQTIDLTDVAVVPLVDTIVGDSRAAILNLFGAVSLLLLVACANVAGLLVVRTCERQRELAVRAALGAGSLRLVQQFLAESFVLSLAGGGVGVLLAYIGVKMLPMVFPLDLPRRESVTMNASVLLFAFAIVILLSLLLAFFATWRAGKGGMLRHLSAGSRSHTSGSFGVLRYLVIAEIGSALVILIAAGLLGRSFQRLISISPGFNDQNLITMEFSFPTLQSRQGEAAQPVATQVHLTDELMARLHLLPGVDSAGLASAIPVAGGDNLADGEFLILNGRTPPANFDEWSLMSQTPTQVGHAEYCVADSGYFRTLGIPLIRGRMFGDVDQPNSRHVALISQSLSRQRWPNTDPIGQIIDFGNMDNNLTPLTIIGIVADIRASGLDREPSPVIYVNYRQRGMTANSSPTIFVRSSVPFGEIVPAARSVFRELTPESAVEFSAFTDKMDGWFSNRRSLLLLVALFAFSALGLAAVGIYGVVAFSVAGRIRELGVRMALGAQRDDILRMILNQGARMAALGVLAGVVASFAMTRILASLLFGIKATDPLTFIGVAVLLCFVTLLASYIPARRATKIDPIIALRYE